MIRRRSTWQRPERAQPDPIAWGIVALSLIALVTSVLSLVLGSIS